MISHNNLRFSNESTAYGEFDIATLPEWQLLVGSDIAVTPEAVQTNADDTAETKRTQCSLNCLKYLYEGGDNNYEALTSAQPEAVKLSRSEFEELHDWFNTSLPDNETYQLMQYAMLIHDIGKNNLLYDTMGIERYSIDHDEVLSQLLDNPVYSAKRKELLPTFSEFSVSDQELLRKIFSVQLNFGQFMQAEAPAVALEGIPSGLDSTSIDLFIIHAVLDITGVAGHINPDSSIILTSPIYKSIVAAKAALTDSKYRNASERYEAYLTYRAGQFGLDIDKLPENMTLIRLACMLRCASPDQFDDVADVWTHHLSSSHRATLAKELGRSGISDRARLPYYGPALLKALVEKSNLVQALNYFGLTMYRAVLADYDSFGVDAKPGIVTIDLSNLTSHINQTGEQPLPRFKKVGDTLVSVVDEV